MKIQVVCSAFPGRRFVDPDGTVRAAVTLGVQRDKEVVFLTPGDAPSATFELEATPVQTEDGWDLRGPYVHGKRGDRFLYLCWVDQVGPHSHGFRRAKLLFRDVPEDVMAAIAGGGLVATLPLTDKRGGPVCASVRPPTLQWSVGVRIATQM